MPGPGASHKPDMILAAITIALSFTVVECVSRYYKMRWRAKIAWTIALALLAYALFLLWLVYAVKTSDH